MMNHLNLSIADVALRLECADAAFLQHLAQERFNAFVSPGEQMPDIIIRLLPSPAPPTRARMESVKVRPAEGGWRFVYDTFVADVRADADGAEVTCLQSAYAVDTFLRALLALYLPQHSGVMLHACAVHHQGHGYLFAGRSGAGKSTVARLLSDQVEVLSDEVVAVRRVGGVWQVYATPFWGEFARAGANRRAPLHSIYLLKHASQHRTELLRRGEALRALLQCSLQFAEGAQVAEWMLAVVSMLVRDVPAYRLHFLPDPNFWLLLCPESS
jgi:hypothetical protein